MAKIDDHEIGFLANAVQDELGRDARELAPMLLTEVLSSTVKVPKEKFLEYVRRNWQDPQFRQDLYTRIAPPGPLGLPRKENVKAFLALVDQVHNPTTDPVPLQLGPDQSNVAISNLPGPIGPGAGYSQPGSAAPGT